MSEPLADSYTGRYRMCSKCDREAQTAIRLTSGEIVCSPCFWAMRRDKS